MVEDDLIEIPFEVYPLEHGTRADLFLSRRIKRMSRSKAARIIREGSLRLDGEEWVLKPSSRLQNGDRVLLKRRKLEEAPTDDIVLPVVFEDEDILAVNKPGNLVVHPTASAYNRTLIRVLRTRFPEGYLSLAHRIDKETSGIVLVAKNREAERRLKDDFAERRVKKTYLAIVAGVPETRETLVDAPMRLVPDSDSGVRMEIGGAGASPAETEIAVVSAGRGAALVEARPRTGRQHQIRLHLAHLGHPILGDKLYLGGEDVFIRCQQARIDESELSTLVGHPRHALHAHALRFGHPRTKEPSELRAPLPEDMVALAKRFDIPVGPPWC